MKRLYIALFLLVAVAAVCVFSQHYQHRQLDRMLTRLEQIERAADQGDLIHASELAKTFATDYQRTCDHISCYVAHSELRESRETAALLPALLRRNSEEEFHMELQRLRAQLLYLQQVDDPLLQNIL